MPDMHIQDPRSMAGAKINTYAEVTSMLPVRDTIWGCLDDTLNASLEMSEGTKMYSKSICYCDNAW